MSIWPSTDQSNPDRWLKQPGQWIRRYKGWQVRVADLIECGCARVSFAARLDGKILFLAGSFYVGFCFFFLFIPCLLLIFEIFSVCCRDIVDWKFLSLLFDFIHVYSLFGLHICFFFLELEEEGSDLSFQGWVF